MHLFPFLKKGPGGSVGAWRALPLAAWLLLAPAGGLRADDESDARDVIKKAIEFHGGQANLAKLQMCRLTVTGTIDQSVQLGGRLQGVGGVPANFDAVIQVKFPDRYKCVGVVKLLGIQEGMTTIGLNSDGGWQEDSTIGQGTPRVRDLKAAESKEIQTQTLELEAVTLAPLLNDPACKLSTLDEEKVHGKTAVGVCVKVDGLEPISLYFDKNTGQLLKSERQAYNFQSKQKVSQEVDYGGSKKGSLPKHWIVSWNGDDFLDENVTEIKPLTKITDEVFARPENP